MTAIPNLKIRRVEAGSYVAETQGVTEFSATIRQVDGAWWLSAFVFGRPLHETRTYRTRAEAFEVVRLEFHTVEYGAH